MTWRALSISPYDGVLAYDEFSAVVGRCRFAVSSTRVERACGVCNQRFKLEHHKLLSTFALCLNLRQYTAVRALEPGVKPRTMKAMFRDALSRSRYGGAG